MIPARDIPRVAWQRFVRELRMRTAPTKPTSIKVGASVEEIAKKFRTGHRPRFFGLMAEHAMLIGRFFPDAMYSAIDEADKIRAHCFDLLGSGEVDLGKEIDWHVDFKSGHHWPVEHYSRLVLTSPTGGFDVKVPWELSRFHHGIRLGQAYLYTLDEGYSKELVDQITHWIKSNPYEFGVNWAGPMDVAIRAVNWVWAVYSILESETLTDTFLALWLASIEKHGEYLAKHLEDGWPRTNHLIANLTALAYLGILFPEFKESGRWKEIGLKRLWEEVERQIYADGLNYEASTSYHRLVTEMILSIVALCLVNNIEVPEIIRARLKAMLDAIMYYTQPNGLAPQIGDADDGRLHVLSVHHDRNQTINDHRHLLALGSLVLERESPEWAGFVDPSDRGWSVAAGNEWQDAFWFFASDAAARYSDVLTQTTPRPENVSPDEWVKISEGIRVRARALSRQPIQNADLISSREFEAGGLYIMRYQGYQMVIDAGDVGQQGAGGHAHNDTLSINISALDTEFLIDPGTYLYTANPEARNLFRSTAYHNTVQVNNEEINRLPEDGELFRLTQDAQVTIHRWVSQSAFDLFDASHTGYARLNPGFTHRRQVWFDKNARIWILHDQVSLAKKDDPLEVDPDNEIELDLRFHFASLPVRQDPTNNAVFAEGPDAKLLVLPLGDFPLKLTLEDGWYSPRYGIRHQSSVARFTGRVKLPADLVLLLHPHQGTVDLQTVRNAGRTALLNLRKTLSPRSASLSAR